MPLYQRKSTSTRWSEIRFSIINRRRRNGQNVICGLASGWRGSYCGRRQLLSKWHWLKFNMNMHHQLEKKDEDSAEDVEDLEERYDRIWLRRICRVRARIEIVLLQFLHQTVVQKEWNSRDAVGRQARLSLSLLRAFTLQNQHSSQTSTLMRPWADRWRWEGQTSTVSKVPIERMIDCLNAGPSTREITPVRTLSAPS